MVILSLQQRSGVLFPLPTKFLMINPPYFKCLLVMWVNINPFHVRERYVEADLPTLGTSHPGKKEFLL